MQIDVRPRTFGENSALVLAILVQRFWALALIQGVLGIPALGFALAPPGAGTSGTVAAIIQNLLLTVVNVVAVGIGSAMIAGSFTGDSRSPLAAVRLTLPRVPYLLGYGLLYSLRVWLGLILLFVPGLFMITIYFVGECALVLEKRDAMHAFTRSSELTRGSRWSVFGMFVLFGLLPALAWEVSAEALWTITAADETGLGQTAATIFDWAIRSLLSLPAIVAPVVVYFSLRAEKEGFDVEQLARLVDRIGGQAGSSPRR